MAGGIVGTPAIRFDVCGGSLVVLIVATIVRAHPRLQLSARARGR